MSPGELFADLWDYVRASLDGMATYGASNEQRIKYVAVDGAAFGDGGVYDWRMGNAEIRLHRPTQPRRPYDADLETCPLDDACLLAHEFGHFSSDPKGSRTEQPLEKLRNRLPLTDEEKAIIIAEEEAAWRLGRQLLEAFGCDDFARFDEMKDLRLAGYRTGLGLGP